MKATTKADVMQRLEAQLAQDAKLREAVDARFQELNLAQQLVQLREARGLSQAQAARLIGVSQPAIAKLEAGQSDNPGFKTLLRAVTALGGQFEVTIKPAAKVVGIRTAPRRPPAVKRA